MSDTVEKTIVINLIGAPSTGKSTIASELFAKMKWAGYDVELVSEYAKELVWEERHETFKNELYLFAKQQHRMFRLSKKVKFIITDRPLILSMFYNQKYGTKSETFNELIREEVAKYENLNFFLTRTKPYNPKGRNQTEEESDQFAKEMYSMLYEEQCSFKIKLPAEEIETAETILHYINQFGLFDKNYRI